MRRLAQAPNLAIATLWADALREEGVAVSVQREYLGAAAGQLPPDQCLPEIWVEDEAQFERAGQLPPDQCLPEIWIEDDEQYALAERLLHELRHRPQRRWHCACGELVEGGFEQCWHCGAMMPTP